MGIRKDPRSWPTALGSPRDGNANVRCGSVRKLGEHEMKSGECYSELEKVFKCTLKYFHSKVKGRPHVPPESSYLIPVTSVLLTQHLCRPLPVVSKGPGGQERFLPSGTCACLSVSSGAAQLRPLPPDPTHLPCQLCRLFFITHQEDTWPRPCEAASNASLWGLCFVLSLGSFTKHFEKVILSILKT